MKVEVAGLGSPSLIVLMVSVDVKQNTELSASESTLKQSRQSLSRLRVVHVVRSFPALKIPCTPFEKRKTNGRGIKAQIMHNFSTAIEMVIGAVRSPCGRRVNLSISG